MVEAPERPVVLYGMTSGLSARGFIRGQAPFLRERGWDVALTCSDEGNVADFAAAEGIRFWPLPLERKPSLRHDIQGWGALRRTLRQVAPDAALWGSPKASLLGLLACRIRKIPAVYLLHGLRLEGASGLPRAVLHLLETVTCRLATVVVADGFALRDAAERLRLAPRGSVRVLAHGSANGVDPSPSAPRYRADLGLGRDDIVVTFAGRLTTDKGIAELASAWADVAAAHATAHLVVAGRVDDTDPTACELEATLQALPNAHLIGYIDDLDRLWADSDIMVLPSYREGLPLVVIEAAAAGVPAVVTDCTGGPESVVDGVTGLVVPRRDAAALGAAIARLLDEPETRRRMGRAARDRALERYDREALWEELEDLLRCVAGPTPGARKKRTSLRSRVGRA